MSVSDSILFRPAVIAPTFNNSGTLGDLLEKLDGLGLPIIVINDGSTDDTSVILSQWMTSTDSSCRLIYEHPQNRGKAAALQRGFAACRDAGFTHAISIDTDGQHSPDDVPMMLALAAANRQSLILGSRDEQCIDYPFRSRWGRRISNMFIRLECGQRVEDSQCGLRVYPLAELQSIRCDAGRYGFDDPYRRLMKVFGEVFHRAVLLAISFRCHAGAARTAGVTRPDDFVECFLVPRPAPVA